MSGQTEQKLQKNPLCAALLAHVDAGKTTLCEALLYRSGMIGSLGRVDHKNAFLDTHSLERARGITIFSKQAVLRLPDREITLLDTPGHVDFSAEMERTLQVLDYAVLVISGTDGVQAHTRTLWRLLERYQVPAFIFVTKMDLPGADKETVLRGLFSQLKIPCADFSPELSPDERYDACAMCAESLMEEYLETGEISDPSITDAIARRELVPCFFGSGLRMEGVDQLLDALSRYTRLPEYGEAFSARVFKISRDHQGGRLTHLKITGGSLKVRSLLRYNAENGEKREEKIQAIRTYSGEKFTTSEEVGAGSVCAVLGLTATWPGQGLGEASEAKKPLLEPVLSYRIVLPPEVDARTMLPKLRLLAEEDPQLHIVWHEALQEIHVQLMGDIQIEVLCKLIEERFDVSITVDAGRILYKETIADPVEGVGHFEPLRHYAEVHLLLEPLPQGSGLQFTTDCSENVLDRNWQRLILTHLVEKRHLGVLIGAPITDIRITLKSGRAHLKHTEGGDFRQATYRAVRQGLMKAKSVLLEPWYQFQIMLPSEHLGRAMSDIRMMDGSFDPPMAQDGLMLLSGTAPVVCMRNYARDLSAYTHGRGQLSCFVSGYAPCHNAARVMAETDYDPVADLENTPDSVFCAHGAGFNVRWDKVQDYMHLDSCLKERQVDEPVVRQRNLNIDDKELEAIMEREFGPIRRREYSAPRRSPTLHERSIPDRIKSQHLIVDGYNIIFAWEGLRELAQHELELAREELINLLINYHGFTKCELIVVFDAYKTPGNPGSRTVKDGVHIVYTAQGETGDRYIEQLANDIGKNHNVRVVTSDALVQLSALRSGILRVSAAEFEQEMMRTNEQIAAMLRSLRAGPDRMHSLIIRRKGEKHGS